MHSVCRYRHSCTTHTHANTQKMEGMLTETERDWGKPCAQKEQDRNLKLLLSFIHCLLSLTIYWCAVVPHTNAVNSPESRGEAKRVNRRKKKKISRTAAEHVAQSNQYFLVTAGISLRNKPSLIKHTENHSKTLTASEDSSQWGEVCTPSG